MIDYLVASAASQLVALAWHVARAQQHGGLFHQFEIANCAARSDAVPSDVAGLVFADYVALPVAVDPRYPDESAGLLVASDLHSCCLHPLHYLAVTINANVKFLHCRLCIGRTQ